MRQPHPLGTISQLWRYPVKALRGEALSEAVLDENGLAGDRRAALFVGSPEHARSGKTLRGKEHNLLHTVADPQAAVALAAERGVAVATESRGPYFDAQPVSLILDVWLHELEAALGFALDPLRFRPNIVARADPAFTDDEHALVGATLEIRGVRLHVTEPTERCVTPSYDLHSGTPEPRVQRALVTQRGNILGVYCTVVQPGSIRVGDEIAIES